MGGNFSRYVWELALSIPEGRVTTYGTLAKKAGGGAMAARSITSILSQAPNQGAIPFHRIVYANGKVWFSEAYEPERRALYKKEGIIVNQAGYIENFEDIYYDFTE